MQLSKIDSKKVSLYKKEAPGRAGCQGGVGLEHVMYKEMLRVGSTQLREKKAWGDLTAGCNYFNEKM